MTPASLEDLFAAVLDTPPEAIDALLATSGADATQQEEVRRLAARHRSLESSATASDVLLAGLDLARAAALVGAADAADPAQVGRYHIVRRLGEGATGVVYCARDPALHRDVALKLLAPGLSRDAKAVRRFEEEARAAGALNHPRVATIYEIGRADDGRLFIAMAYQPGETLRARLERGPLAVRDALDLAAGVAEGLEAAHEHGIVHRDIKPENVLLTPHGPILLDFGIAKIAGVTLTRTGAALGTVAYMSPEQTRGDTVDSRSDIWSVGVLLYEMLTGERPFRGDAGDAVVYGIRHDAPPPLRSVPPAVAVVVARCLDKAPSRRYASASEVRTALQAAAAGAAPRHGQQRAVAATGGLAALVLAFVFLRPGSRPAAHHIGVLPFATEGETPERAYVDDGLELEVTRALGATPGIRVTFPGSMSPLRDSALARIGERLGVRALVRTALRHHGDSVHVAVDLVKPDDGTILWAQAFDRPVREVAATAEGIRAGVAAALGAGRRAPLAATPDLVAYDLYLRGQSALYDGSPGSSQRAIVLFREALARDSGMAKAYLGLAEIYVGARSGVAGEGMRRAQPLVARALALDSTLSQAHRLAGWIAMWYDRDWGAAERHFARALGLDSSDIWNYHHFAAYLAAVGRTDESMALTRAAQPLDPTSGATATHIGLHLLWQGRVPEAIAVLERVLEADPNWRRVHMPLGRAYLQVGRYDDAIRHLRTAGVQYAAFEARALLAEALARAGQTAEARSIVNEYEARARASEARAADLFIVNLALSDTVRALHWLERIPDDRGSMVFPLAERLFDPVRGTPQFRGVVERMGLADAARRMTP